MAKKRYRPEEIIATLEEADKVPEVAKAIGIYSGPPRFGGNRRKHL